MIWLLVALGFFFLWPTKWPQYILILTVPLALAAATGSRPGSGSRSAAGSRPEADG